MVLLIALYKVVLKCEFVDESFNHNHSNESYKRYFPVLLFILQYKVVLTSESACR